MFFKCLTVHAPLLKQGENEREGESGSGTDYLYFLKNLINKGFTGDASAKRLGSWRLKSGKRPLFEL